ncbi:uncharacterized protein LOC142349581 isoform X2 [Convolutriloba macropyga]|uniref:uncharacterized protein LOC142349581 isoform X2 n=1 Tax=Convolutriloba macropyga TaxID=536237 RepID=UPI003F51D856
MVKSLPFSDVRQCHKLNNHILKTQLTKSRLECGMLCARTAECLSYNFCHEKICQLNLNDASIDFESLFYDSNCYYAGFLNANLLDCYDGKSENSLGDNCDFEYKVGELRASSCLTKSHHIYNYSEFDFYMESVCDEIYCYRGERIVNNSLCNIELGTVVAIYNANYRGNMTFEEGIAYCLSFGNSLRTSYEIILKDPYRVHYKLRRLDHPAFVQVTDAQNEGIWVDKDRNKNQTELLVWDSDPKFQNSDLRDYGAVNGSTFQAYAANDTGPDVLCSRSNL